jgi:hypothetical protein
MLIDFFDGGVIHPELSASPSTFFMKLQYHFITDIFFRHYSLAEKMAMVKFMVDHDAYDLVKGRNLRRSYKILETIQLLNSIYVRMKQFGWQSCHNSQQVPAHISPSPTATTETGPERPDTDFPPNKGCSVAAMWIYNLRFVSSSQCFKVLWYSTVLKQ